MRAAARARWLSSPPAAGRARWLRLPAVFGLRITFSGLLSVAIILLVGLAALHGEASLLFLLFSISVGIVVSSAAIAVRMVRKIEVERTLPQAVVAGRPFTITYVLRNRRRWARAWSLVVGEIPPKGPARRFAEGFIPALAPGRPARLEVANFCPRRGRLRLPGIRLVSRFPFGLFACTVNVESPADLVVYPMVGRFRRDPWKDGRYAGSVPHRTPDHGGRDEFYGVREYREGDSLHWIHWRQSAHAGQLMVREMAPLRETHLIVILDPWPDHGVEASSAASTDEDTELTAERLISAAATAICEGLERGYRVGLICRAAVPLVIPPAAGRPHRQRLLHELAGVTSGATRALDELVVRVRWATGWHARCMICTGQVDAACTRLARLLGGRTEGVIVLSPESEAFDALFDSAGTPAPYGRTP